MNLPLNPEFNEIDRCFADFIGKLDDSNALMPLAAAMLSRSVREGNICWRFDRPPLKTGAADGNLNWPAAKDWRSAFSNSKAVGGPDANTPLVMDESDRLYLRRYWTYQRRLAQALRDKASGNRFQTSRKDRLARGGNRNRPGQFSHDHFRRTRNRQNNDRPSNSGTVASEDGESIAARRLGGADGKSRSPLGTDDQERTRNAEMP